MHAAKSAGKSGRLLLQSRLAEIAGGPLCFMICFKNETLTHGRSPTSGYWRSHCRSG